MMKADARFSVTTTECRTTHTFATTCSFTNTFTATVDVAPAHRTRPVGLGSSPNCCSPACAKGPLKWRPRRRYRSGHLAATGEDPMALQIAEAFVAAFETYVFAGLAFAVVFLPRGVEHVDPRIAS